MIALDPRHPVVGELSGELNASFRRQADDSRRQTDAARTAAEQARASGQASFAEARQLVAAADTSYKREEFTVAAQKYQQARIAFERAKRESDEARAAARGGRRPSLAVGTADGRSPRLLALAVRHPEPGRDPHGAHRGTHERPRPVPDDGHRADAVSDPGAGPLALRHPDAAAHGSLRRPRATRRTPPCAA